MRFFRVPRAPVLVGVPLPVLADVPGSIGAISDVAPMRCYPRKRQLAALVVVSVFFLLFGARAVRAQPRAEVMTGDLSTGFFVTTAWMLDTAHTDVKLFIRAAFAKGYTVDYLQAATVDQAIAAISRPNVQLVMIIAHGILADQACSIHTNTFCERDSDCPEGETCIIPTKSGPYQEGVIVSNGAGGTTAIGSYTFPQGPPPPTFPAVQEVILIACGQRDQPSWQNLFPNATIYGSTGSTTPFSWGKWIKDHPFPDPTAAAPAGPNGEIARRQSSSTTGSASSPGNPVPDLNPSLAPLPRLASDGHIFQPLATPMDPWFQMQPALTSDFGTQTMNLIITDDSGANPDTVSGFSVAGGHVVDLQAEGYADSTFDVQVTNGAFIAALADPASVTASYQNGLVHIVVNHPTDASQQTLFDGAAAILFGVNATVICGGHRSFGGDDPGCIPPTITSGRCENRVAKAAAKLVTGITKCHIDRARGKLTDDGGENACESAAISKFTSTTTTVGCGSCADLAAITSGAENLIDRNNDKIYCTSTGTPFGGDDTGNIPPDAPKGDVTKCENHVAKAAATLVAGITKCHVGRARGKLTDVAEQVCKTTALNRFETTNIAGCDSCTNLGSVGSFVESSVDAANSLVYCASPNGAFL